MKKILLIVSIVLAVALPFSAFAAASDTTAAPITRGFCGIDASQLTDQQKADLDEQFNKMMVLKKESINKMVANGALTKAQGDAAIDRLDDMIKYHKENGFTGGFGMGRGAGLGRGMGRGFGGGCIFGTTSN